MNLIEKSFHVPKGLAALVLRILGNFLLNPFLTICLALFCFDPSYTSFFGFFCSVLITINIRGIVRSKFSIDRMNNLKNSLVKHPDIVFVKISLEEYLMRFDEHSKIREELKELEWRATLSRGIFGTEPTICLYVESSDKLAAFHLPGDGKYLNSVLILQKRPEEISKLTKFFFLHELGHIRWKNTIIQATQRVLAFETMVIFPWLAVCKATSITNFIITFVILLILRKLWHKFWLIASNPQIVDEFAADSFAFRYLSEEEKNAIRPVITKYKFFDCNLSPKENELRHQRRLSLIDIKMTSAEEDLQLMLPRAVPSLIIFVVYLAIAYLPNNDLWLPQFILFLFILILSFFIDVGGQREHEAVEIQLAKLLVPKIKKNFVPAD